MTAPSAETDAEPETVKESFGTGGLRSLLDRTGWAMLAEAVNLVVVAIVFKVVAEQLGKAQFGAFQAIVGIAAIVGPVSTFGANWQLIRRGVVSDRLRNELGRSMTRSLIGTSIASALVVAVLSALPGLLPELSRVTLAVGLGGQVIAFWLLELAVTAAVARADLRLTALCRIAASLIRLAALAGFAFGSVQTVDRWVWWLLAGNLIAAAAVHLMVARSLGGLAPLVAPTGRDFVVGFPYGLGNTTESVLAASDRPLMTHYHSGDDGIYSAGYRIVTLGLVPTMALFRAQDRRFFRQGTLGSAAAHHAGFRMSLFSFPTTVSAAIALFLAAPYLDLVIDNFEGADSVIRLLAVVPIIKGVQFAFGNSLTAAGNQKPRLWLTAVAAVGNLVGNLIFIPAYSWRAAATTTLVAEVWLAVALFVASTTYARREREQPMAEDDEQKS